MAAELTPTAQALKTFLGNLEAMPINDFQDTGKVQAIRNEYLELILQYDAAISQNSGERSGSDAITEQLFDDYQSFEHAQALNDATLEKLMLVYSSIPEIYRDDYHAGMILSFNFNLIGFSDSSTFVNADTSKVCQVTYEDPILENWEEVSFNDVKGKLVRTIGSELLIAEGDELYELMRTYCLVISNISDSLTDASSKLKQATDKILRLLHQRSLLGRLQDDISFKPIVDCFFYINKVNRAQQSTSCLANFATTADEDANSRIAQEYDSRHSTLRNFDDQLNQLKNHQAKLADPNTRTWFFDTKTRQTKASKLNDCISELKSARATYLLLGNAQQLKTATTSIKEKYDPQIQTQQISVVLRKLVSLAHRIASSRLIKSKAAMFMYSNNATRSQFLLYEVKATTDALTRQPSPA